MGPAPRGAAPGYGPADATEQKLVTAIAAAMWNEIRADRTLTEAMAAIPPLAPGRPPRRRPAGAQARAVPQHALRYMTLPRWRRQRAQRAFLAHRKAKRDGLILPDTAASAQAPPTRIARTKLAAAAPPKCTNELPSPVRSLAATTSGPAGSLWRARLHRLLPRPRTGGRTRIWDLVAAIRAVKLPGGAPYRGPIDAALLRQALDGLGFDAAGLAWLAAFRPRASG